MSEVVLVEAYDPDDEAAAPVPHPLRTPAGRRVALVAAAGLVGLLVADVAADQTRLAAIDAVPSAMRPFGSEPRPLWTLDEKGASILDLGFMIGGVLVGPVGSPYGWGADAEGVTGFVGLDPEDGTRLWEMPVAAPDAADEPASIGWCTPAGELALCTTQASDPTASTVATESWLLDPDDGAVLRSWTEDAYRSSAPVGGVLVEQSTWDAAGRTETTPDGADHVVVTATDPLTDETRWTWTSPSTTQVRGTWWTGNPTSSGQWLVTRGEHAWLFDEAGLVRHVDDLVDGAYSDVARDGGLVEVVWRDGSMAGPDEAWYVPVDGKRVAIPGPPMWLQVDDGSAPGLLMLQGSRNGTGFVAAVDAATGKVRWRVDVEATQAMLVGGRLVLLRALGLTALDAQTGEQLWVAESEGALRELSTDGEVALAARGDALLEAFALDDGRRVWERDLVPAAGRAGGGGGTGGVGASAGEDARRPGAWLRMDTPLPYPVVVRPDGTAVVMG